MGAIREVAQAADAIEKATLRLTPKIEAVLATVDDVGKEGALLLKTLDLRADTVLAKVTRLLNKFERIKRLDVHINLLNLFRRGRTVLSFTPVFEEV